MATFNYIVDTEPMAEEISSMSRHVNATTGAVVAMQTAVILAEQKAADHVCDNLNRGFYALIHSQISQKMAKLQSDVDSNLLQLIQQKKALLSIRARMERDYQMIAARYIKLFNGLNTNLRQRIFELDKPTIDFAVKEIDKVSNRNRTLTAIIPITQSESLLTSQKIVISNIKYQGLNVIKSGKYFLSEMHLQKKITKQVLINNKADIQTATFFIPVAILGCNRESNEFGIEISISQIDLNKAPKTDIRNIIFSNLPKLTWKDQTDNRQDIKTAFNQLVLSSTATQRLKDRIMSLFQLCHYQNL